METENEQAQDVYEQDGTSAEVANESEVANEEEFTPPSKAEYTKLKRKAMAYDALKEGKEGNSVKAPAKENSSAEPTSDRFKELELKIEGYTQEEIEQIREFGFDKINNPIVKRSIEIMRKERKSAEADKAIPNKSQVYQKYTNDDLKNMSVEDLRKILPHAE